MNLSALFIHRPVATTLLTIAIALAGAIAFHRAAGFSAAAGGLSDHLGGRGFAGGERPDHGIFGGHPAGAAVWPHCGSHGDDFRKWAWHDRRSRCSST